MIRASRSASCAGRRHQARIDDAEHAFAREHETGANQPRDVGRRRDHKRQPECSATMPPERLSHFTREKPAARIISAKALGLRKFPDRFDEVLIGFGVAGDGAAERRDHLEREEVIEPVEPRHVDGGEFQAQKSAAGFQHAIGLAQREHRSAARCGCRTRWCRRRSRDREIPALRRCPRRTKPAGRDDAPSRACGRHRACRC